MIEQMKEFPKNVIALAYRGRVTKADYQAILPAIEEALAANDRLRVYFELGAGFSGIEADAVLEDFKIGMQHLARWERVAVVTDVEWITHAFSLFGFLIPGAAKIFSTKDADQARSWIISPS